MNHYYIRYTNNFGNTYQLYYAPAGDPVPADWTRITREAATRYCREERERAKCDPSSSGLADAYVYPAPWLYKGVIEYIKDDPHGYIIPLDCLALGREAD